MVHLHDIAHLDTLTGRLLTSAARLEQSNRRLAAAAAQLRWRSPAGRLCQQSTELLRLRSAAAARDLAVVAAELSDHARRAGRHELLAGRALRAANRLFLP